VKIPFAGLAFFINDLCILSFIFIHNLKIQEINFSNFL